MQFFQIVAFLLSLILFYSLGFFVKNYSEKKSQITHTGLGTVEGSLLALFAFFLGFTFNISASKIESVRQSSVSESNAIGTALLRSHMYQDTVQTHFKELFITYLQDRIRYFDSHSNPQNIQDALQQSVTHGNAIWEYANELHKTQGYVEESRLMIPALNDMIDSVSTRDSAINATLPNLILYTLYALSMLSCFIVGFSMKKKLLGNFIGMIYILIIALTVNLIIDASNPRTGLINTHKTNQSIVDIYESLQ